VKTGNTALCVALDAAHPDECERLARVTSSSADMFKVGLTSYAAGDGDLVARVGELGPVFLDVKLHDIPAQVAGAVRVLRTLGVAYVTAHAAGGAGMVEAAVDAAEGAVQVLAVTVLTSLGGDDLATAGVSGGVTPHVLRLAELALEARAAGLVCSPREVEALRARFGARAAGGPLLVVPGIRTSGAPTGDQRRVASPGAAAAAGADVIVVGRPITAAPDPALAAAEVTRQLDRARA
jgi:orotidine-5'-phosphate decarboxylase